MLQFVCASFRRREALPIVSIVVPFWGLPFRILNTKMVKPKKGTAMEIGRSMMTGFRLLLSASYSRGVPPETHAAPGSPACGSM